jgi:hypothetical protein
MSSAFPIKQCPSRIKLLDRGGGQADLAEGVTHL